LAMQSGNSEKENLNKNHVFHSRKEIIKNWLFESPHNFSLSSVRWYLSTPQRRVDITF
jgi:hypothetical protein